nr:TIM-barrel domain-containing protein [Dongshaea marina]
MHCGEILEQEKDQAVKPHRHKELGQATGYSIDEPILIVRAENGSMTLKWLSDEMFRVVLSPEQQPCLDSSDALIEHGLAYADFSLEETQTHYRVSSPALTVEIARQDLTLKILDSQGHLKTENTRPFNWYKKTSMSHFSTPQQARFYGMGEKTGYLDKKGRKYVMWNTDIFDPHVDTTDPLYLSVPFFIHRHQQSYYGIYFDNYARSQFDLGRDDPGEYVFGAEGGKMDFYYIGGDSLKSVVSRYSLLTGRAPMPPKWCLGYQQSRYSYRTEDEVREIATTLRQRNIPCDTLVLDIHYMDGYRVFSWDPDAFPNPEKLMADLKNDGFNVVTIVDPGVKKDSHYGVYVDGRSMTTTANTPMAPPIVARSGPAKVCSRIFRRRKCVNGGASRCVTLPIGPGCAGSGMT